ncbi:MAG: phosphoribosyltransferase [Algoriphagus sp.]|uniref:phosphoribosyltransferase family protein n=1 Tax=Algoriphagus sp. TaxID=1872435 RepID=UPI00181E4C6D|nr:phosphoribosyltransferase family protein [Algoriphagus sp.]NVJ86948.1 phosphoribosyltransferase [Algoriphagus sp.]
MSEVLNDKQIRKKVTRMAYEIYERNLQTAGVVFAGVSGMGLILSNLLASELRTISDLSVEELEVKLDKSNISQSKISLSRELDLSGKSLILVDDVLNTGRTVAYAMKPFLEEDISKMELAVLVNRAHGLFPLRPDYTGYELATTLNEHIQVDLSGSQYSVHLL